MTLTPRISLRTHRRRASGFTLVELLVVMAIILILSGIVIGVSGGISGKQSRARAETELATIAAALEAYRLQYGDYPWVGADSDGAELFRHLTGVVRMEPTSTPGQPRMVRAEKVFLDEATVKAFGDAFTDPWGRPYEFYYKEAGSWENWQNPGFILISKGPDGKPVGPSYSSNNGHIDAGFFSGERQDNLVYGLEF
ncbi:MAG: prepilin-type N-terminal cleavage/methylation domain-containing protein [Verrucomicrobiota bacterium]